MSLPSSDFEITFRITLKEVEVLLMGLAELPLKTSGPVFNKLQQQVVSALRPPSPADSQSAMTNGDNVDTLPDIPPLTPH